MQGISRVFVAVIVLSLAILVTLESEVTFTLESRIIGGNFAEECQFPYVVRMVVYGSNRSETGRFQCGGSIIAENWVLTAGHCYAPTINASQPVTYHIEAGSIRKGKPRQADIITNDNVFPHPDFNLTSLENDIALIKTKMWTFDHYVCPIDIALGSWTVDSYVGKTVTAMGFGYISSDGPTSEELRWTRLVVISRENCKPHYNNLPKSVICAEDKKNDPNEHATCSGDSGGPIVLEKHGKLVQIGLVSFGSAEGCTIAPDGYTNVAMFHDWITRTMTPMAQSTGLTAPLRTVLNLLTRH